MASLSPLFALRARHSEEPPRLGIRVRVGLWLGPAKVIVIVSLAFNMYYFTVV